MGKKLSNREKRAEDYGERAPWQAPVWGFFTRARSFGPRNTRKTRKRGGRGTGCFANELRELKRIRKAAGGCRDSLQFAPFVGPSGSPFRVFRVFRGSAKRPFTLRETRRRVRGSS